jgi:hypothetical protein
MLMMARADPPRRQFQVTQFLKQQKIEMVIFLKGA